MPRPKLAKGLKRTVPVYVLLREDEAKQLDVVRGKKPRGTAIRDRYLSTLKRRRAA